MCLLALFFRIVPDAPLVIGANREEAYARVGEPPQSLPGPCRAVGGRDPTAGGTWLGVNEHGVLIAVTNRRKSSLPTQPRSRGLLVRELLAARTAGAARDQAIQELSSGRYAGCNLVCADASSMHVLQGADWLRVRPLPPGIHVLTNHDVNDDSDRRLGHALWWLYQRPYDTAADCIAALKLLCAQTGNPDPPICLRGDLGGTVSSSIIALRPPGKPSVYLHAQGPPDATPYQDYSHLLHELSAAE
ncbi:MAG: NRDE family protein [Planctomycetia bacterium]|nr:NRDE family protein [Planctomycetia bacterium]